MLSCLQGQLGRRSWPGRGKVWIQNLKCGQALSSASYDELGTLLCTSSIEWRGDYIRVAITEATSNPSSDEWPLSPVRSPAPWIHWLGRIMTLWLSITRFSGERSRRKRKRRKWEVEQRDGHFISTAKALQAGNCDPKVHIRTVGSQERRARTLSSLSQSPLTLFDSSFWKYF